MSIYVEILVPPERPPLLGSMSSFLFNPTPAD